MPTEPRFVFDTNAIISAALLKRSVSRQPLDKALDEGESLVSAETIDELNQVLGRVDAAKYVNEDERRIPGSAAPGGHVCRGHCACGRMS